MSKAIKQLEKDEVPEKQSGGNGERWVDGNGVGMRCLKGFGTSVNKNYHEYRIKGIVR